MKLKIISLIIVLVLITGCTKLEGFFGKKDAALADDVSGIVGLDMKFTNMPSEIMSGQTFDILVDLENKGKANIEDGIIIISGYNDNYISLEPSKVTNIRLEGSSQFMPIGESTTESFRITKTEISSREYVANFVLTACYKYTTEAAPTVCINPQILFLKKGGKTTTKQMCITNDYTLKSQGAPISVKKVTTQYSNDYITFKIEVENEGSGRVRAQDAYAKECIGPALKPGDLGNITIQTLLGGEKIECSQDGFTNIIDNFKLRDKKGSISCRAKINEADLAYESPLTMILDYGYIQSINQQVKIVKI